MAAILKDPEVLDRLRELGVEPVGDQPDELAEHIRKEYERWRTIIESAGLGPK